MQTVVQYGRSLEKDVDLALARYRHEVFVKRLGWELNVLPGGLEKDQYDRWDTVYVIAYGEGGAVCGCARLLPTTKPYLLQEHFQFLLSNACPPTSSTVWELSRFAASSHLSTRQSGWAIRNLLTEVVRCAVRMGAKQLIGVTFESMERLFRRIGVRSHRAGPAEHIGGRSVVACWIDLNEQTFSALGIEEEEYISLLCFHDDVPDAQSKFSQSMNRSAAEVNRDAVFG